MKKIIAKIKNKVFNLIISFIVLSTIGVCAATSISSSTVSYDTTTSGGTSTNVSGALNELYTKAPTQFKVGDYIKMTPTKTSFTIPKTLTGYTADQTIKPSELNLWRVMRLNSNGTIDMVSEYVSSVNIYIAGKTGFLNYIGTLNYIAKQYENTKYTADSRHMGYNGQTEYITDTSKLVYPAPWTSNTGANTVESQGGGDQKGGTDVTLVISGTGKLPAYKVNTSTAVNYWLAARFYTYAGANDYRFGCSVIPTSGTNVSGSTIYHYATRFIEYSDRGYAIRPILTLKPWIKAASGSGTSASPYVLS